MICDDKYPGFYYLIDSTGLESDTELTFKQILAQGRNIGYFYGLPLNTGLHRCHVIPSKMGEAFGSNYKTAVSSLMDKSLNLYEERLIVQKVNRDLQPSHKVLTAPLEIVLNEDLTTKFDMMQEIVQKEKGNCSILNFQVASARCIQGLAVDQVLFQGKQLGLHPDDFYISQVIASDAKIQIESGNNALVHWSKINEGEKVEKIGLNYVLKEVIYDATRLFEVRENVLYEIQVRESHRGIYIGDALTRLHSGQDRIMKDNLGIAIEQSLRHAFDLQKAGCLSGGALYKPVVDDIVLSFAKDGGSHEVVIRGISNFTDQNIKRFSEETVKQITRYVYESTDQKFSDALDLASHLHLGDFRTSRNQRINLLRTRPDMTDVLYMPARSAPIGSIQHRESLRRMNTAPGNIQPFTSQKRLMRTKSAPVEIQSYTNANKFPTHLIKGSKSALGSIGL